MCVYCTVWIMAKLQCLKKKHSNLNFWNCLAMFMETCKVHTMRIHYNNHLNTKHPKSEPLTFWTTFCQVFKWFDQVFRWTIWIPDSLDHKTDNFVLFLDHHLKTRPCECQTCLVFKWWCYNLIEWEKVFELLNFSIHAWQKALISDAKTIESG